MCKIKRLFFILFFMISCTNITKNKSSEICILIKDSLGNKITEGVIGIHFNDFEENPMDIIEDTNRVFLLNSLYNPCFKKDSLANFYRVNQTDKLFAFYYLYPDIYLPFVLDLNKNKIEVIIAK